MAAAPVDRVVFNDDDTTEMMKSSINNKSVADLIKESRMVSVESLMKLDKVSQSVVKLSTTIEDHAELPGAESEDPIMAYELENLRQALRETAALAEQYKSACTNLEHYLRKLEEHNQVQSCDATVDNEKDVLTGTTLNGVHFLDYVTRSIHRCNAHVEEHQCQYNSLNTLIGEVIDKYCTHQNTTNDLICGGAIPPILLSLLSPLMTSVQNRQTITDASLLDELSKVKHIIVEFIQYSKTIRTKWTKLQEQTELSPMQTKECDRS